MTKDHAARTGTMQQIVDREIEELVVAAEGLSRDAARSDSGLGPDRIEELSATAARGGQLIRRLYGANSHYERSLEKVLQVQNFNQMHSNWFRHVSELAGILKGVQRDIRSGLLADIRNLVQAEIFADFLEMAEYLLGEGYKDASAVLLGAVLEDSLRKIADGHGVSTVASSGKPLTIDPLNAEVAKTGVYNQLVKKQITTWANLRNDAAHGHFDRYDADQVRQMLIFVQKFCSDYLK